jgi:hypothetical protein
LEWFGSKEFVLGIVILSCIVGGTVLSQGPLFHDYQPNSDYHGQDPLKFLYADCVPSLSSWQVQLVTFVGNSGCGNNGNFGNILRLGENSTTPAIAIDQTPMDLSTASSKVLEHDMVFAVSGAVNFPTLDFYITSNRTLPVGNYDPFNDKSTVYLTKIQEVNGGTTVFIHEYIQKDVSQSIGSDAFDCPSSGTVGSTIACWTYSGSIPTLQLLQVDTRLNFTGQTGQLSMSNFLFQRCPTVPCTVLSSTTVSALPNFPLTGNYYMGIYASAQSGPPNIDVYGSIDPPNTNPYDVNNQNSLSFAIYTPNPPAAQPPPYIDTGGFFGPVIKALIGLGVYILNAILGFVAFIAPALQTAIQFLETQIQNLLNIIGNALGFGNVGDQLFTFLSQVVTFFTSFLPTALTNFPTFMARFFDYLNIVFPILPSAFATALTVLTFAVNGISEALTIFIFGIQFVIAAYAFFLIFSFMVFTADDALGGVVEYLGTAEALAFFLIKWAALLTNLGLDIGTWIIGLIPKPFIQMAAARLPRIPILESSARIVLPSFDFGELRSGNLLSPWLWTLGFWFDTWYESRNPALPGSLCNLVPATCTNMQLLSNLLPLMQVFVFMSSGVVTLWLVMRPLELLGADLGIFESIGVGLGRKPVSGLGGISIAKAGKHFQGRLKKSLAKGKIGATNPKAEKLGVETSKSPEQQATA